MENLSVDEASKRLAEANTRQRVAQTDAATGAAFTSALGILVAATLAAINVWGTGLGIALSMVAYGIALVALLWWQRSRMRVAERGWARAYGFGFGGTMALYIIGIIWSSSTFPGWAIFAPFCVLVAVPTFVSAVWMLRR